MVEWALYRQLIIMLSYLRDSRIEIALFMEKAPRWLVRHWWQSYSELIELAERGERRNVDLLVKDTAGGDYNIAVSDDLVSSFGKAALCDATNGTGTSPVVAVAKPQKALAVAVAEASSYEVIVTLSCDVIVTSS